MRESYMTASNHMTLSDVLHRAAEQCAQQGRPQASFACFRTPVSSAIEGLLFGKSDGRYVSIVHSRVSRKQPF